MATGKTQALGISSIKSSADGSSDRGKHRKAIFASGTCCVSNIFKASSWPFSGGRCRVSSDVQRLVTLQGLGRGPNSADVGIRRHWATRGFLPKDGETSQVQGFETIPFSSIFHRFSKSPRWEWWQVHPCVAIQIVSLRSPHTQVPK